MATLIWPLSLPQAPLLGTFKRKRANNLVSFEPDVGASIDRRRSTKVHGMASFAVPCSRDQMEQLDEFYEATDEGATAFTCNWLDFLIGRGAPFEYKFRDAPDAQEAGAQGPRFNVAIAVRFEQ